MPAGQRPFHAPLNTLKGINAMMKRLLAVVAATLAAGAALAETGFVRAVFQSGSSIDVTSSIWEAANATVVSGVDDFISVASYDFPEHTTYAYGTYMYLEAGVTYCIRSYVDDNMRVTVDGTTLISTGSKYYAAFRFAESGWHKVELRFFNNGGPGGGNGGFDGCTFYDADGVWKRFSTANGQFRTDEPDGYAAAAPTIVYQGSGGTINVSQYTGNDLVIELGPWASLPNNAFKGNTSITSVKITGSGDMGTSAFENCTSLTKVEILGPSIGASAFKGCTSLSNLTFNCSSIGNNTFQNCSGLTSVTIPDGVTSIGQYAFLNCTGLSGTLTIPGSVTSIGNYAFYGCSDLTGLVLSSGVTSIGQYAFQNCTGLSGTLTIPGSVTSIGNYAFYNCSGFTGSLTIPGSVTSIGAYAFHGCSGFTGSLTIPESVTNIDNYAFYNCSGFTGSLTIPGSVTNIGTYAFSGCSSLTGVTVLGGAIRMGAFSKLENIRALSLAEGVTSIESYAFDSCRGLTGRLTIPNSVTNIGSAAFRSCSSLTGDLVIPGSVKVVGGGWSRGGDWVDENFNVNGGGARPLGAFCYCTGFTGTLTIEDGVERIGVAAFQGCSGFKDVVVPKSIKVIGFDVDSAWHVNFPAFGYCIGVKNVTIAEGAKIIGGFYGCTGLTEIEIPNSVTNIDAHAFSDCTELVNVNMPTDIKVIGEYAFSGCHKLLKLEWLPGVTVGQYAFQNCSSWQGVFNVPEGVTEIAPGTFYGCSGLQQVNLPESLTKVGERLFQNCTSLEEVSLPHGLTNISRNMFEKCRMLKNVVIPDTVTIIDHEAFWDCKSLTELVIPHGVTTLGGENGAFIYSGIQHITIPSTLVNVDQNAFRCANALSWIEFSGELPVGYELWDGIAGKSVSFPRASGSRGLVTWPVTQFMGYTQTNAPTVTIISSKIRENDPEVMDVVYKVTSTKPTVKVRALAFENGVRSFANIVRPEDFIADLEGNETKGNIGDAVTANVEHTLSWKVSSDWATRLAKVSFEVLATEDDILPLELMTIPGTPAHPETWQISWNYITADKSFEALLWLYADKDLGLTLQDGVLKNGSTRLCSGATVSAYDALVYVYGKMGFTLLDGDALTYVKEATRFNLPDKSSRQYAYRVVTPAGE